MIAEKGLACEERDVSLPQSEHKEPWFMRLNLGEEVPVIIHRDNIISDYDQIIDYVERTFTGGTALPPCGHRLDRVPCHTWGHSLGPWARPRLPRKSHGTQAGIPAPQEPQSHGRSRILGPETPAWDSDALVPSSGPLSSRAQSQTPRVLRVSMGSTRLSQGFRP